jgi:exopolyphosphatase/guanosine-5'-triphosphate,3'-diphosphate pyrophosphatase
VRRRLAAIDLGTNTVRVLVADPDPAVGLIACWADQHITRLGRGLTARGTLDPAAVERTLAAVRRYRDRALALGAAEIALVATAAVRDARDGPDFLGRLQGEPGIVPRVVSGEEEARLTLLGATWGLGALPAPWALIDIGGGSTELAVTDGTRVLIAMSLRIGVVELAERFFADEPIESAQLAA